ncbi:MAG: TonB-dependent receptor [Hyphomonadaceae bacterium]|nr:TonB-dependent receptor [Hyphomonadaceae bacterium]
MQAGDAKARCQKFHIRAVSTGSLIALCTALAATSSALAQQASGQENEPAAASRDVVVVTAQFREQNLQDIPLAVTTFDAELLEARSQTDISQIANQAPNVTLRQSGGSFGPAMGASIRGVGQYDFNPALEPGVGIYIDDVYLPTLTGALLDLLDLERVEILRGPQGTLTGRNSVGGAVRMVSRKPSGDNSGFIEGSVGSRDRTSFRGSADFALAENLFARISGVTKQQRGYVQRIDYGCAFPASGVATTRTVGDCHVSDLGNVDYNALRGMLRFAPNDRFDLTVSADYTLDEGAPGEVLTFASLNNVNTNPTPGVPFNSAFICGEYCNYTANSQPAGAWGGPVAAGFPLRATSSDDEQRFEGRGVSANMTIGLTDSLDLVSISAYREYEASFNSDDDLSPANIGFGQNRLDHDFLSQELRLNGEFGEAIAFTVGAYYSDQTTTYFTYQDIRYAPIPLQFIGDDPVNADTRAVFGTFIWSPMEAFNLTGGVRYTEEHKDYTFLRQNPDGTPNPFVGAADGVVGVFEGDRMDYRLSADYRWTPSLMTYATFSTGFKGGGVNPRPFFASQVLPFGEEIVSAYEVGFKSDLFDDRLRFNAAAFFNEYEDIQLTLLNCSTVPGIPTGQGAPCALPQNAGDAEVQGLEIEFSAEPIDGLSIDGSASTLDFEYTRVDPSTGLSLSGVAPFTPELKWSIGIQYEMDLGGSGTLTPRFDASYTDGYFTNASNSALGEVDSYTIANVRLTWRNESEDLSVSLEGLNIFDEYYLYNKFDLTGAGAGWAKGSPGRPREWGLVVRKDF